MHGEVCTYVETWSVPSNALAALADYESMFRVYLFNITNTTLFNISVEASSREEFVLRREMLFPGEGKLPTLPPIYPAKTPEPGQLPEQIDYWDRGRRVINRDIYGHDRKKDVRIDPAPEHGHSMVPHFEPSLIKPVDWRNDFFLPEVFPQRVVEDPLNSTWSLHRYRGIDCALPPDDETPSAAPSQFGILPEKHMVITAEFLMSSERGREACLTLTSGHNLRDYLTPFSMVPCRDRSFECRSILEFDPAPSPPPPQDWVIPPSPPVFGWEVEVATFGISGMGIYCLVACLCCSVFGGRSLRQRHTSRWPWTGKLRRVDGAIPYTAEESRLSGENYDHLTKGHVPMRGRDMAPGVGETETAAHQAFVTRLASGLLSGLADAGGGASAGAASASAGGFTFASLVGGPSTQPSHHHQPDQSAPPRVRSPRQSRI